MLEQFARNKRRTVLYLGVFVVTWLGKGSMHRLFDTHPPIADRIAILERMQQGLTV